MWRTPATLRGTLEDVPGDPRRRALILGLETSCDDTCAAVVTRGRRVRSNVVSSQGVHDRYGGVVPEIASRHHLELVNAVVDDALARAGARLDDVDLVAVTQGPGLVGALLVGRRDRQGPGRGAAAAARAGRPPAGPRRRHLPRAGRRWEPPFLCLLASGGHTLLARVTEPGGVRVLGRTLDDAAGEAFDKGARLLGLPYPGRAGASRLAEPAIRPRSRSRPPPACAGLDFSFAG